MKHPLTIIGISLLLFAGCDEFHGMNATFYVSPNGSDTADGQSPRRPFRSIERARDAARERDGETTIAIADGVYELSEPIAFTAEDRDIVFAAAPKSRPTVSAGRRIPADAWKVGADGRWRTKTQPGERFSQFYVNGQRRVRPFLPRTGYYYVEKNAGADPSTGEARFVAKGGHFPVGDNPDLEVCLFHTWTMSRSLVKSFTPSNRVVHLGIPDFKPEWSAINSERWYRYDNVKSAFGEPGDWYLDVKNGELSYVPMPGETPQTCETVCSRLQHNATFTDTTNITWRGITFAYADYGVKTNGNYVAQAASGQPGALQAIRSKGIRFENCAIIHTGAYGANFFYGSEDCALVGCELRDLGAGGVEIGDGWIPDRKYEISRNCEVSDCLISEGGRVDPAGVGVWIGHGAGNKVSHNTIHDLYYSGISAGWNWSFHETARDNILEWNHIYDIGQHVLSDMGGIYLLGCQPGTVERYNHIHHVTRARNCAFGVYFDSGTSFVTVTNNVVHDCEDTNFFLAAISASNVVENNIFVCGTLNQIRGAARNPKSSPTRYARNLIAFDGEESNLGTSLPTDAITLTNNLYWCPDHLRPKKELAGCTFAPLKFADLDRRDLRIADTNMATSAGFIPFSIEGCGKKSPVTLTKNMAKVPAVFFPAPEQPVVNVDEDFESVPVGGEFPGWSVLEPDGTNTVRVTDRFAATGRKSLEIIDDKKDWRPHIYRSVSRTRGLCRLSFSLRIEKGARPRMAIMGRTQGPVLSVAHDGTLAASDKPLTKLEFGRWYRIEIAMQLGKGCAKNGYSVTLTPDGGKSETWNDIPLSGIFRSFSWIGIHSCGASGRYHIDDFKISEK